MSVIKITKDNFQEQVMQSDVPVLIDFWAEWCGPCRMVGPVIDELGEEVAGAKIAKVNVDEQPELAAQFNVMSIPTIVIIKNGQVAESSVGVKPKAALLQMIEQAKG